MRFGRIFYLIVLFICLIELVRLWNITPAQMAVHFNVQGLPDRFAPKMEFFQNQIRTLLIAILVSVPPQILFLVLPPNRINMPHREYWFAPERHAETAERLSSFGSLMFGIILLALQAAFEVSAYANLRTPIMFNVQLMGIVMTASFLAIGLLLVQLIYSFSKTPSND